MTYTQAWTRKEKKVVVLLQLVNIDHPLEQWGLECWITERGGESVIEQFNPFSP
jgi:hypothetical protein